MAGSDLTIALNLRTMAPTQYSNWSFNSFAFMGAVTLAANDTGLYSMGDNDTDAGTKISAWLRSPTSDFGVISDKNFQRAYLAYKAAGNLSLEMRPEMPWQEPDQYCVDSEYVDLGAFKFSRYWSNKISNQNGCDFALFSLELISTREAGGQESTIKPMYRACGGLNNLLPPQRIAYNPATGECELAACQNIDIDDSGLISRRDGYTQRQSGAFHSLWNNGEQVFVVSGGTMYLVNGDYSLTAVVASLTVNAPVSYEAMAGIVFWANGQQCGFVDSNGVNHPWQGSPYVGPDTIWNISLIPPLGTILKVMDGRMLVVQGNTLFYSMQFAPFWYRFSRDYVQFESDIQMCEVVKGGVWLSDSNQTYFLHGHNPPEWLLEPKAYYPAIARTSALTDGSYVGKGEPGIVAIWCGTQGICIGTPGGEFSSGGKLINLTENKLVLPPAIVGAGMVSVDNNSKYVVCLQP